MKYNIIVDKSVRGQKNTVKLTNRYNNYQNVDINTIAEDNYPLLSKAKAEQRIIKECTPQKVIILISTIDKIKDNRIVTDKGSGEFTSERTGKYYFSELSKWINNGHDAILIDKNGAEYNFDYFRESADDYEFFKPYGIYPQTYEERNFLRFYIGNITTEERELMLEHNYQLCPICNQPIPVDRTKCDLKTEKWELFHHADHDPKDIECLCGFRVPAIFNNEVTRGYKKEQATE